MSQNDEARIDKYIEDNYFNPKETVSLLCSGPAECTFLDVFTSSNPGLPFLTEEDLRALSHENYVTNGGNLQKTLEFIKMTLKKYYNFVFDIWICFRFTIIERIPDGITDPEIIQKTITDYLPGQLITLLYYLFDSIFFYNTITLTFPDHTKRGMIKTNVVDVVLLYSRLYIFLQQPDPSLSFFTFNKQNLSLVFLSNVMVYKCFDSLHKISSILIENYIACLQRVFNQCISIFGDTPTDENKQKIDFALGHLAIYFLSLPNLSLILSNSEVQPIFISHQIEAEFEKKEILFLRGSGGKIEKLFTIEAVEKLKRSGQDVSKFDVRRNLDFNPMPEITLQHAIQFISAVRIKINEKQRSTITETFMNPIIEELKQKYFRFKDRGYDYFSFIYNLSALLEDFILKNSTSKENRLILRSNFSQCCIQIPEFIINTMEEDRRMKILEERKQLQLQKEAQQMKEEQQRNAERMKRFDKMKFRKEQQQEREEERRNAQLQAAAASPPAVAAVSLPKELTEKEKEHLRMQRNTTFKRYVQSIFPEFSTAIQSGQYEEAASMINKMLTPKLHENVPWTAENMKKFPATVKKVYDELLLASAPLVAPGDSAVALDDSAVALDDSAVALDDSAVALDDSAVAPGDSAVALDDSAVAPGDSAVALGSSVATPLSKKDKKKLKEFEEKRLDELKKEEKRLLFQKQQQEKADAKAQRMSERKEGAISKIASVVQMAALQRAQRKAAAFNEFEKNIGLLCGGNGITYFETMFHCSLPQFFRIITVVRELPDQEIIKIMSSLVPAPDSASARTGPLTSYMDLENSGRNCRALFALALLNGIRRIEHVRFSFVGRTFLQLITCHSMLPVEACKTLHIPKNTSDIDVYVIFNPDKDPITLRPLFLHIFNLFWKIPPGNIHIHYSRDNASWRQFEESGNGHLYESVTRGTPDVMKISFNHQGRVFEVSDIGFKTVQQFAGVFRLSLPPPSRDKRFETLTVNELKLLELKYTLDQEIFSFNPQYNPCVVQLDLQFPSALSGFDESIDNVFKILNSFLNNQLNLDGSNPDAPIDFYFIHVSNLLKFIVRIIQYKGISGGGVNIQNLHANVNSGVRSLRVLQFEMFIADAAIDLINLFFKADGSINDDIFRMVDEYRTTSELKESGAAVRVEKFSAFHTHILNTLRRYGFFSGYLDYRLSNGVNLYGGLKQKQQQKQQRHKYTKKNRRNKNKKYSKKLDKIKKIKIRQNGKKSLKYHKQNNYKVTKKY
jgi:hypothetical protein